MAQPKNKKELGADAETMASSYSYVHYQNVVYIPTDYETGDDTVTPPPERMIWLPLSQKDIQLRARAQFDTLFESEAQLANFHYMVAQGSQHCTDRVDSLLVRTAAGLRRLGPDGKLHDPDGRFIPNTLKPLLNEDRHDRKHVLDTMAHWLDSEEDAHSLLHHLATALAPHWSSVKYLLFLGAGRNGKSLLMHMLTGVFGRENVSGVTRQDIAENSPVVLDLNAKLLNIVFDGMAAYLKDSGREKSLIAGEAIGIRRLYSSTLTQVQTNGLFIEGLNQEPKSSDKSTALQSRIVRFGFPHVFEDDPGFWKEMLSDKNLGALLNLLIEHYVLPEDAGKKLALTTGSIALQMEHMELNSKPLQFLKYLHDTDPDKIDQLIGSEIAELVLSFNSWKLTQLNDIVTWSEPDVVTAFRPVLTVGRKSKRVGTKIEKVRVIAAFTKETLQFLEGFLVEVEEVDIIKEEADATTVVDD